LPKNSMTILVCVFVLLGEIAIWLDLGNRLFGSYARTPVGSMVRVSLMVLILLALAAPLAWIWIDSKSHAARLFAYFSACAGAVAFVHFLVPYRHGIVRVVDLHGRSVRELVPGIALSEMAVRLPALPSAADGMTCLVLSDFHCNDKRQIELIRGAIERLQGDRVDLVLLLGDFGETTALLPGVVGAVTSLPGRFGTFCVLGNHDYEGGRHLALIELLGQRAVRVLADEFHDVPELGIVLLGLAYPWSGNVSLPEARDGFVVGLTHSPDNLPYLDRIGVPIAFAGHTHGGKFRVPGLGAILVPSRIGRFLDAGWFRCGNALLYLTRGIGYFPGRFGNTGEICRFTFHRP
jgi:predicted MPP superfamily phosphohydrolase